MTTIQGHKHTLFRYNFTIRNLDFQTFARLNALSAPRFESTAHVRAGFIYSAKFIFLQKWAGFQKRKRIQLIATIGLSKLIPHVARFDFHERLSFRILPSRENRETPTACATLSAIIRGCVGHKLKKQTAKEQPRMATFTLQRIPTGDTIQTESI
jgi:hypothetical protein